MAQRTNSPLKTFVLLAMVVGLGWLAYEYLYVRRVLVGGDGPETVNSDERQQIREAVLSTFEKEVCFGQLGPMTYRGKEGQWRIDVEVPDGCIEGARDLCRRIGEFVTEEFHLAASVWAFDDAGSSVAHYVP